MLLLASAQQRQDIERTHILQRGEQYHAADDAAHHGSHRGAERGTLNAQANPGKIHSDAGGADLGQNGCDSGPERTYA